MAQWRNSKMIKGRITASKQKRSGRTKDGSESELGIRWFMPYRPREELGDLF